MVAAWLPVGYIISQKAGFANAGKKKNLHKLRSQKRYNDKTYRQYLVSLRVEQDADLIAKIEELKKDGYSTTDAFRKLITIV